VLINVLICAGGASSSSGSGRDSSRV